MSIIKRSSSSRVINVGERSLLARRALFQKRYKIRPQLQLTMEDVAYAIYRMMPFQWPWSNFNLADGDTAVKPPFFQRIVTTTAVL